MQTGMEWVKASGIVGLSPQDESSMADMFILRMRDTGVIEKAIFSFMIDVKNDRSKLLLGGYDLEAMAAPGEQLTYHSIIDEATHWTLKLQKVVVS